MALLRTSTRLEGTSRNPVAGVPVLLFALVAALLSAETAGGQPVADEYHVKAAYLLNFARFIEWPADALPPSSPLNIVIVGDDPFGGALETVLRTKSANGHRIHVRRGRWNDNLTAYQIVFISASEEAHLPEILRYLGDRTVLTVSDIDRFALRGGIIEFHMVGNRVRFDINRSPANAAQLKISSKLLSVARTVHESRAAR